ncbi:FecR family protein [Filimonas effusa]|nr:FecR family protein [Filimonas effusa]
MEEDQVEVRRLLVEKLAGTISEEEDQVISRLIASDNHVRQEWHQLRDKMQQATQTGHFKNDANNAWEQLQPAIRPRTRIRRITAIATAAAACVAAIVAVRTIRSSSQESTAASFFADNRSWSFNSDSIIMRYEDGSLVNLTAAAGKQMNAGNTRITVTDSSITLSDASTEQGQWNTLFIPAAMNYKVTLPDGSEVWLNAHTRLRFPQSFAGLKQRDLYVDGEAFFKVAPDKQQPFIVHTARTDIRVLGTQFNVNTYDTTGIKTALVEGSVSATAPGGTLILKPGQQTTYTGERFTTTTFDVTTTLSWMQGIYYFEDVPLKSLTNIVSRWFKMKVIFHTPELANKVFNGMLSKKLPLSAFLENLELSDNIYAVIEGDTIHFK